MSLLARLFKSSKTKVTLTKEERVRQELERVNAEPPPEDAKLSDAERSLTSFSQDEKRRMYEARELLKLLPSMSVSVITKVVDLMKQSGKGVTKQHIHQVIYPPDPKKLFISHNTNYKKAWVFFTQVVEDLVRQPTEIESKAIVALKESPAGRRDVLKELKLKEADARAIRDQCELRDAYRATAIAIDQLIKGHEVLLIGPNASRLKWIRVKLRKLGITYTLRKDDSVYPGRCLISPSKETAPDAMFSLEKWLQENSKTGIRSIGFDPLMKPYLSEVKAEEVLFGKQFKVYHVLATA